MNADFVCGGLGGSPCENITSVSLDGVVAGWSGWFGGSLRLCVVLVKN